MEVQHSWFSDENMLSLAAPVEANLICTDWEKKIIELEVKKRLRKRTLMHPDRWDEEEQIDEAPHRLLVQLPVGGGANFRIRRRRPEQRHQVEKPSEKSVKSLNQCRPIITKGLRTMLTLNSTKNALEEKLRLKLQKLWDSGITFHRNLFRNVSK